MCVFRAQSYAERLRLGLAVIHGEAQSEAESDLADGQNSLPVFKPSGGPPGLELPGKKHILNT